MDRQSLWFPKTRSKDHHKTKKALKRTGACPEKSNDEWVPRWLVLNQFGIPVGAVNLRHERHPFAVPPQGEHLGAERRPFRPPRFADQQHPSLFRRLPAFPAIAVVAGADDVLPSRGAAARARNHMVQVQFGAGQPAPAVLAGIVIAGENIEARKSYVAFGYALVGGKQQHARHPDDPAHDADALVMYLDAQVPPRIEIEGAILLVDRARDALVQERKTPLDRGDVNRKIRPVQHQDLGIENGGAWHWRPDRHGRRRHYKFRNCPDTPSQGSVW